MKRSDSYTVYVAPRDRVAEVKGELKRVVFEKENFLIAEGPEQPSFWAQNLWSAARVAPVESIAKAAQFLKHRQRNWWHFPLEQVRRTKLIQDRLPSLKRAPLKFPELLPTAPLGSFALLSSEEMIYSANCRERLPNGEMFFLSPDFASPSEAYLKLWEALTKFGSWPRPNDRCVDLGSSPGSWTQALLRLGAEVVSVDKAELALEASKRLEYLKKDAFKLRPSELREPQWIFSDIICFPEKLLDLAHEWVACFPRANFIFTLKFQGQWDPEVVRKFANFSNARVEHLFYNKHELCWMRHGRSL